MSESNKFTPGPWFHHGPSGSEHTAGGFIKSSADRNSSPLICSIYGTDGQPHKANANLIAAAPDLLEALENLLWHAEVLEEFIESERGRGRNADQLYADGEMHNYMVEAKASILKARGQQ